MADYTGTKADDNFTATNNVDHFYFGENEGVDLILNFNTQQDQLVYTDRSVDGFDDLDISQLRSGDTVIESNDQYTVLHDISPSQLTDDMFVFATSGPRGSLDDARDHNPVPDEVNQRDINQRVEANGGTVDHGGVANGGGIGHGGGLSGVLGSLTGFAFGHHHVSAPSTQTASTATNTVASDAATTDANQSRVSSIREHVLDIVNGAHAAHAQSGHQLFGGSTGGSEQAHAAQPAPAATAEPAPSHHFGDHVVG